MLKVVLSCGEPEAVQEGRKNEIMYKQRQPAVVAVCWAKAKSSLPANSFWRAMEDSRTFLSSSRPCPLPFKPCFPWLSPQQAQEWLWTPFKCGGAGKPHLGLLSMGSIFESFNYLGFHEDSPVGFLLVCHIPPTKELMVYLSLGRTHPVVWMSHLCVASHIYPCRWFW